MGKREPRTNHIISTVMKIWINHFIIEESVSLAYAIVNVASEGAKAIG